MGRIRGQINKETEERCIIGNGAFSGWAGDFKRWAVSTHGVERNFFTWLTGSGST